MYNCFQVKSNFSDVPVFEDKPHIYRYVTVTHKQAFTIQKLLHTIKQTSHIISKNESQNLQQKPLF